MDNPLSVGGTHRRDLVLKLYGHLLIVAGRAPDGNLLPALKDHVIAEDRRELHVGACRRNDAAEGDGDCDQRSAWFDPAHKQFSNSCRAF